VRLFLAEPFLLPFVLAACDLLFLQPGAFLAGSFFLLCSLGQVVCGQFQFLYADLRTL